MTENMIKEKLRKLEKRKQWELIRKFVKDKAKCFKMRIRIRGRQVEAMEAVHHEEDEVAVVGEEEPAVVLEATREEEETSEVLGEVIEAVDSEEILVVDHPKNIKFIEKVLLQL